MTIAAPKGYIKLARRAFDLDVGDPFWLEQREYSRWEAWVDVLQLAAFRARKHVTSFGTVNLCRGEFVASLRFLADRWTWSVKKVRVWLATLEKWARMRAQREEPAGTVYLIVNYDRYQLGQSDDESEKGTPDGTAGAQQGHKKEPLKQLSKEQKTPAARPVAIDHSWPAEGTAYWQETVGRMSPGRFGKALKEFVDKYGWPAVRVALIRWVIEHQASGKPCKIEWFADECAQQIKAPVPPNPFDGMMDGALELATRPAMTRVAS